MRWPLCAVTLHAACGDDGSAGKLPDAPTSSASPGIYVTNYTGKITVFDLAAEGDVAPLRTIAGPATGLSGSIGIDVDHEGLIYVANRSAGTVTVYPKNGTGDLAPVRTLTTAGSPEGVAITSTDEVIVSACPGCGGAGGGTSTIYHFAKGATTSDYTVEGSNTKLTAPGSIAIDPATNDYWIGNSFGGELSRFSASAMGNVAPAASFSPGTSNLQAIAFAANTVFVTDPGAVIRMYSADATGTPGSTTIENGPTFSLAYPGGIYVDDSSGQPVIYVVDYTGDAVWKLTTTGRAPELSLATATKIQGDATQLDQPLWIRVIP